MSFGENLDELVAKAEDELVGTHSSWQRVKLGEVATLINGFAFKSKHFHSESGTPLLRIRDVVKGRPGTKYNAPVDDPKMRYVTDGDIVVGMDGDFNCKLWSGGRALINQRVCTLRAEEKYYSQKFLAYVLPGYLNLINAHTSSVTVKHLSSLTVQEIPLPLPPRNEQDRIVEKIETLFAQIDKGEEALSAVPRQLQVYRQSVLKAAVTGELTRDWREATKDRLEPASELLDRILETRRTTWSGRGEYKQPSGPEISDLPELPAGWVWASIDQLANVIGGLTKNRKRDAYPLRKPMLRVANVYQNRLELSDIHETGVTESEYERAQLEDLDLLVVEGNGSKEQIGRMAVWRNEVLNAVHQNHLIKVRMIEKRLVNFILYWFCSPSGRTNVEKVASSTSGLYTLSLSKVRALVAPVPSLAEALVINERVVYAFDRILALDNWCEREIARSKGLRQSILKDAFSGRLVPQNPRDESASDLLARIKADHDVASTKKRRRAGA